MNCRCLCHGQILLCDPPKMASEFCKTCDCNKIKREKVMIEEKNVSPMVEKIQELEKNLNRLIGDHRLLQDHHNLLGEVIRKLEFENDHHCGAITVLERWKDQQESVINKSQEHYCGICGSFDVYWQPEKVRLK